MQTDLTEQQAKEFNLLFEKAGERMQNILSFGDYRPRNIGFFEKLKVKRSIRDLEKCLIIVPDHWASMLFIAKAHQTLGEHEKALSALETAMKIELQNHNLPQEASLECIQLNDIEKALLYSEEALKRKPNDIVLLGNHAMNLLIDSKDEKSLATIRLALDLEPEDRFNQNLREIIMEVMNGYRKRPTCRSINGYIN